MKAGLFGIGLATYWHQFDGLKARLEGYQQEIAKQLRAYGATIVDTGLVE